MLVGYARYATTGNINDCLVACLEAFKTQGFNCRSIIFFPDSNDCILNEVTRLNQAANYITDNDDNVVYLDNLCPRDVQTDSTSRVADLVTTFLTSDQTAKALDQISTDLCNGKTTQDIFANNRKTIMSLLKTDQKNQVQTAYDGLSSDLGNTTMASNVLNKMFSTMESSIQDRIVRVKF
uniref:Apple domain-containing protein n=1 Tax=Acrobeloides nanus TaxID=290746 RepID=A0A914E7C9_9BILA